MYCTNTVGVGTVGGWARTDWRFALIFYDRAVNAIRGREEEGRLLLQYRRPFSAQVRAFFPEIVPLPVSTPLRLKSSDTSPSPFLFVPRRARGDSEGNRGRGREGRRGGGRCHEFTPPARQTDDSWEKGKEEKRRGEEGEKLKPSFRHFSFFSFLCLSRKLLSAPP